MAACWALPAAGASPAPAACDSCSDCALRLGGSGGRPDKLCRRASEAESRRLRRSAGSSACESRCIRMPLLAGASSPCGWLGGAALCGSAPAATTADRPEGHRCCACMSSSGGAPAELLPRANSCDAGMKPCCESVWAAHGASVRPSSPPLSPLVDCRPPLLPLVVRLGLLPASLPPASDARRERGCEAVLARLAAAVSTCGVRRGRRKAPALCGASDSSEPSVSLTETGPSLNQPLSCCRGGAASGPSLAWGLRRPAPSPPPGEDQAPPSADRRACRCFRLASLERLDGCAARAGGLAAAAAGGGSGEAAGGGTTSTHGLHAAAGRRVPLPSRRGERPPAWGAFAPAFVAAGGGGVSAALPLPAGDACSAASRARTSSLLAGWCWGSAANRCSRDASSAARPPSGTRRGVGSGRRAGAGCGGLAEGRSVSAPAVASPAAGTSRLPLVLPSRRRLMLSSRAPMAEAGRARSGAVNYRTSIGLWTPCGPCSRLLKSLKVAKIIGNRAWSVASGMG